MNPETKPILKSMLFSTAACAAALALGMASANAEGIFVGASIGQTDIDGAVGSFPVDDEATAFKLGGGYRFNESFALQLGYTNFGAVREELQVNGFAIDATADLSAVTAAAEFRLPVGEDFKLAAKLGVMSWEVDNEGFQIAPERSGEDLFVGVGATYEFSRNIEVIGEWERYAVDTIEPDVFSLGLNLRF